MTRRWFRSVLVAVSLMIVLAGWSLSFAAPASAAHASVAAAPRCSSGDVASGSVVNPLNGTSACAGGPTTDEQRYEAALAGAGLLAFGGAVLIYRRRHPRGPRGVGPRAPQV